MFLLSRIFLFLTKSADQRDRERDDAYLAEATDIYDLEYRMKRLDQRAGTRHPTWMAN
ncbi:DUF3563 family protein [Caballeronia sp. LP006]|jgi:hypothetical protein|uniref:DUF3563 family protein n=1 Tax=unclassified Caballeronia TaxID=2646786 RepID=UPI001FD35508|nr:MULTISPECIES: DUF3563 family protein [unclassified Caballeronia]MDR5776000.1 DUF3563 family protein [Caballeronia sp. LZ002]MDR5800908.1 DUF3563 family protein [Caballeronia sp. LZ001]MDR5829101.1 DUF3563 family protein [Caballeronia sp. LP006]MDR5851440.1 DUF3563 family protein [Caballeronia sp. LZ003]